MNRTDARDGVTEAKEPRAAVPMPRARPPAPVVGDKRSSPSGVTEAVRASVEAIQAADPGGVATGALEAVAVLSAAGVGRELLHAAGHAGALDATGHAGALGAGGHRVATEVVDQALAQLAEQELLTPSDDGRAVIMHPLVAQVIRAGLARTERLTAVCQAVASVLYVSADAVAGSQDRAAVRDIVRQVTALLASAGPAGRAAEPLASVMMRLRFWALRHLIELGDGAPQAIEIGEPLAAELELTAGPDHPDTVTARNGLAAAYQAAGRPAAAVPLFEGTLVTLERVLGPDHPDTLSAQDHLAGAYQAVGRLTEAILLFRLTVAARESRPGPEHPSTLNSLGNLAAAYRAAGRLSEAVPLLEHILASRERQLGPGHSSTLAARNNLAAAYRAAGRPAEAIPLFEQNLAACEQLLGADHPRTAASRRNLTRARQEAGLADQVGGDLQDDGP